MNRFFISLILALLVTPVFVYADPLCSDGTPAPAGNICNCGTAAAIGGGTFTPGAGSGLSGNTYSGLNFSGVGGALMSCANIGGAISGAANSLFGGGSGTASNASSGGTGQTQVSSTGNSNSNAGAGSSVPTADRTVGDETAAIRKEEEKTTRREQCLNGAAYAVAKTALQKLSDKTLNWVKTGFNGNPLYIRDIDSYLGSIKNEKLNNFVNNYVQSSDPVFGNALRSIIKQQATGYSDGLLNKAMNTPEGRAYQDFQDDFTQGGWNAFLNPRNDPVAAYFNASDELSTIIDNAQQNVRSELQEGNGFLSMKKCVEYAGTTPNAGNGTHADGTAGDQDTAIHGPTDTTTIGLKPQCIRYETVTPGSIISEQVANITNATANQLLNADSINEVLGAFFDQLMNRLFSDGLTGAGRGSLRSTTSGGFGSNVVTGSNGTTLASPTACQTPLGYNATTGGFNDEFDISRPQQLRAIIETQKSFLTRSQDAQYIMQSLVPRLGALDYCIPGPNPTWNNNLNDNTETFVSQLQEARARGNNALVTIGGVISPLGGFGIICSIFSNSTNCNNNEHTVGWTTSRVSLFDKVDFNLKQISDRVYQTGAPQNLVMDFFATVLDTLKSKLTTTYNDQAIINAYVAVAPVGTGGLVAGDIKESIKETSNLIGYAQGVAGYNEQYNFNIQTSKDAITELEAIDREVEALVATAKARYIQEQAAAGTPVKLSCIDNAYQLGTVGPGLPHLQNITGTPDPMIQKSLDAKTYFYSHL